MPNVNSTLLRVLVTSVVGGVTKPLYHYKTDRNQIYKYRIYKPNPHKTKKSDNRYLK